MLARKEQVYLSFWQSLRRRKWSSCSYFALIIVPIIPAGITFINDSYSETGGLFWIQSYDSDHTIVEGIFQWISHGSYGSSHEILYENQYCNAQYM